MASDIVTQTTCKPSANCVFCTAKRKRFVRTVKGARSFFHHLHDEHRFQDCEDQTYERVSFGMYEHKPAAGSISVPVLRRGR